MLKHSILDTIALFTIAVFTPKRQNQVSPASKMGIKKRHLSAQTRKCVEDRHINVIQSRNWNVSNQIMKRV